MQHDIGQVVQARVQTEELHVEQVGKQGDRNPVAGHHGSEGRADGGEGQAGLDVRVMEDNRVVIEVDEIELKHLGTGVCGGSRPVVCETSPGIPDMG